MQDCVVKGRQSNGDRRGELNGFSRLSERDAAEIKWLLRQGQLGTEIALRYGVANSTVYNIKQGIRWPDVEPVEPPLPKPVTIGFLRRF
jgi:DNA invertase Pin-like site-specific DNA recombinase